MCGICGYIKWNAGADDPTLKQIKKMSSVLKHRGPDDEGVYIDPGKAGLGQRRLSIIDITRAGHQPMRTRDGRYTITYNGECYNFREIREELIQEGCEFDSLSDTEVVLQLYRVYGAECVTKIRGFFAFGIWDRDERELFLARDRMGQKPLFFSRKPHNLFFASEIKSILAGDDKFTPEICAKALQHYTALQYIPPPETIYKGIEKVPPATWIRVRKDGSIQKKTYWRPAFKNRSKISFAEAKYELHQKLREAIRLRMISDVPLGAFLSGGIDSSISVALMAEISPTPVKTFSIGFENEAYNELPYAKKIANIFHTDHHEFIVNPSAAEILPKLVWHYDEPFSDSSAIPTYYVSRETRKHVTVAISGDGGDESFAGYQRYKGFLIAKMLEKIVPGPMREKLGDWTRRLPFSQTKKKNIFHFARRFFEGMHSDALATYQGMVGIFSDEMRRELLRLPRVCTRVEEPLADRFAAFPNRSPLDRILSMDIMTYLSGCLLTKVDVASMAVSLETRSPFLDHEVIDFAASLPGNYKLSRFRSKWILKEIFKDRIPGEILYRKKAGFSIPVSEWLRGELKPLMTRALSPENLQKHNLFSTGVVQRVIREHLSGYRNHCHRIWNLLVFQLWYEIYIEKKSLF